MNVQSYLTENGVPFELCRHRPTYDASHLAEAMHVDCKAVAKTVLLRLDGGFRYALAILPASHVIDVEKLSKALGGTHVQLATEAEVAERCPQCEVGVLPPFGSQCYLETLLDPAAKMNEEIIFEGNSHGEAIRMQYTDFIELEQPMVVAFATPAREIKMTSAKS